MPPHTLFCPNPLTTPVPPITLQQYPIRRTPSVEDRWDYLDDDYADEKPFVKIKKKAVHEEGFVEKPSKIRKKGRRVAQRFKEFQSPKDEPETY